VVFLQRKGKSLGGDLVDPSNLFFSLGLESFGVLASLRTEGFLSWSASVYQKHLELYKFSSCIELEGPSL
jgi:hypothetical protein